MADSKEIKTKRWKKDPSITRYYWPTSDEPMPEPGTIVLRGIPPRIVIGGPTIKKSESEK
jgi:hypothetical protein